MPPVNALHLGYFAAVDTLWRDIDLQSIESFIQFSRALDPYSMYSNSRPVDEVSSHTNCGTEQEQSRQVSETGKTTKVRALCPSRASSLSSLVPCAEPTHPSRLLSARSPSCSMSSLQRAPSFSGMTLAHYTLLSGQTTS